MKIGFTPRTGNHKGCPYDGFAGACFHSMTGLVNITEKRTVDVEV